MNKYSVSIVGLGYVGLTMGICFASKGIKVYGVDINKAKIKVLKRGFLPIYEEKLDELFKIALEKNTFIATDNYEEAITNTNITFLTVGTPSRANGSIDLSFVKSASESIASVLKEKDDYHLVVVKSTVIPGTTRNLVGSIIRDHGKILGEEVGLCMNPEFLREGQAVHDLLNPDRIIIGEYDKKSGDLLEKFWRSFYENKAPPILRTNLETAEMVKYANNAFLALKISFANTIANICQHIPNCDVNIVMKGIGYDSRICPKFLRAGLGFGGSCLPKDVKAIIHFSEKLGYDPILLKACLEVNEKQPYKAIELLKKALGELKGKRIAILGLAFKPGTDDMREAVSIKIVNKLIEEKARVIVHDPKALRKAKRLWNEQIDYAKSIEDALRNADGVIIVTEWDEYKKITPETFKKLMKRPIIIDGRRIYNVEEFRKEGVKILAIGYGDKNE